MGLCWSGGAPAQLLDNVDGGKDAYHSRYLEDDILGEGQFGVVRVVHDVRSTTAAAAGENEQEEEKGGSCSPPPGSSSTRLACKTLHKGATFRDNTLYTAIKPAVLIGEVTMLRVLNGKEYCLKLLAVYETRRVLHLITEYCSGGDMMEYVSRRRSSPLSVTDVSRISYQLLSAVAHCAANNIIHRDIKPENIMFCDAGPKSEIRLIDFGSGCINDDDPDNGGLNDDDGDNGNGVVVKKDDGGRRGQRRTRSTFAGSAFYISPEMFQRTYTEKTDVWSAGVSLYVLAAGYPAEHLQKAFNMMHTNDNNNNSSSSSNNNKKKKKRRIRDLPGMQDANMPDSYMNMIDGLLTYRHRHRPCASEMTQHEFVQFHLKKRHQEEEEKKEVVVLADAAAKTTTGQILEEDEQQKQQEQQQEGEVLDADADVSRKDDDGGGTNAVTTAAGGASSSLLLQRGSVLLRHAQFLDFRKFERSLTALLAAALNRQEFDMLLDILSKRVAAAAVVAAAQEEEAEAEVEAAESDDDDENDNDNNHNDESTEKRDEEEQVVIQGDEEEDDEEGGKSNTFAFSNEEKLHVVTMSQLKEILQSDIGNKRVLKTMEELPNANLFNTFAYQVDLLKEFSDIGHYGQQQPPRRRSLRRTMSGSRSGDSLGASGGAAPIPANSLHGYRFFAFSHAGGTSHISSDRRVDDSVHST